MVKTMNLMRKSENEEIINKENIVESVKSNGENGLEGKYKEQEDIMINHNQRSHKILFMAFSIIVGLASLTTLVMVATGTGSEKLTLGIAIVSVLVSIVIIAAGYVTVNKYKDRDISKYIAIGMASTVMFIYGNIMTGAEDLYITFYLIILISIIYMDSRVNVFTSILVLILYVITIAIHPILIPQKHLLIIRIACFIFFGISSAAVTKIAGDLLMKSIRNEKKSAILTEEMIKTTEIIENEAKLLGKALSELNNSIDNTKESAEIVSKTMEQLALASEASAEHANNTFEISEEISQGIGLAVENSVNTREVYNKFKELIEEGMALINKQNEFINQSYEAQNRVKKSVENFINQSNEVSGMVGLIGDIADQTNLISLNAAIEAARAGEHGRGFAVVAEEVKKLAEQSTLATQKITEIINHMSLGVKDIIEELDKTDKINTEQKEITDSSGEVFQLIGNGVINIDESIGKINEILEENLASIEDIVKKMEEITANTQQTAASTQEVTALTEQQLESMELIADSLGIINNTIKKMENISRRKK